MSDLQNYEGAVPIVKKCVAIDIPTNDLDEEKRETQDAQVSNKRSIITLVIIVFINVIILMNRYIFAVLRPELQSAFNVQDSNYTWLMTVINGSYVILAPFFGYMGDHWNRKCILCIGITFWSSMTLCVSFIPNEHFLLLLLTSALVGAGGASFVTIAPSIIADLFGADQRSKMLAIFYSTIPVGCGLAYIVGPAITTAAGGDWHWAFRFTPGLGVIAVLLVCLVMKEPTRAKESKQNTESWSFKNWVSDIKTLFKNPSFMCATLGNTAANFIFAAIGFWAPSYLAHAQTVLQDKEPCDNLLCNHISLVFGALKITAGTIGVVVGVTINIQYHKVYPRLEPVLCACSMLCSAPLLFLALIFGIIKLGATYAFMFFGETLLAMNAGVVADIILSVVSPRRRCTAQAMRMMMAYLLGNAVSPYLIGLISELFRRGWAESPLLMYRSLEYSLMSCVFMGAIGAAFFFATAIFIEKDQKKAAEESEEQLHYHDSVPPTEGDNSTGP